jgi:hypothetical protein
MITIDTEHRAPWISLSRRVLRIMPEEYVDEFFRTGRLRLSSFRVFAEHSDEQRGDKVEGLNVINLQGTKHETFLLTSHGQDAYVLCGSACETLTEDLADKFGSRTAIFVRDATEFGLRVSRQIGGFRGGMEGACIYRDGSLQFPVEEQVFEQLLDAPNRTVDMRHLTGGLLDAAGATVFFRKGTQFQSQMEYRWVWIVDNAAEPVLFINCPAARDVCEKAKM